jgi:vacuolar-type H+-ATPase subunit F/Vma7
MKRFVRAVSSPSLAPGFRLAGLLVDEASAAEDAAAIGDRLLLAADRPETGILLVEEALFHAAPEVIRRDLEKRAVPILVPVPGATFAAAGRGAEDYILDLLRRAIGYRVRLQ